MKFSQILNQKRAEKMLLGAVRKGRVANAYLFLGQYESGIREEALAFASALNCSDFKDDSCGVCASCRKIERGIHPDVLFLKPDGSSIKIDQIRELISYTRFGPSESNWKVVIIDDARAMTAEAANSFLKTLEEPLPNIVFVLLAETEVGIPQTIISRCQKVLFAEAASSSDLDEEIKTGMEKIYSKIRSVRRGDAAGLLEISSELGGDGLEEKLEVLTELVFKRDSRSLEATKAILSASSAIKKRANKKLTLDVLMLRLGEGIHVG